MGSVINVVYDLDGVLNQLNEFIFSQLGIAQKLGIKHYNLYDNTDILTGRDINNIISMYHNAETFRMAPPVVGADRIKNVIKYWPSRVNVIIHSLCYNHRIKSVKMKWIKNNLEIHNSSMRLEVGSSKGTIKNATIVVEDSLDQLLKYDENTVKILIDKTYNRYYAGEDIVRVNSLNEAIDKVEEIIGGHL